MSDYELLITVVSGGRLNELIHYPIDSGIDES